MTDMRRSVWTSLGIVLMTLTSLPAIGQEQKVTLEGIVSRVQSRGAYIDMERAPFAQGDTLTLDVDPPVRVRVAGVTSTTLLIVWLDSPPALEMGARIRVTGMVWAAPSDVPSDPDRPAERGSILEQQTAEQSRGPARQPLSLSGYYTASLTASYSDISGRFTDNRSSTRTWATPTSSLRLRARDLPAGLEMTASLRGAHRLSSEPISGNATMMQLFELNVSRTAPNERIHGTVGRFRDANSPMGGYYDGARGSVALGLLRIGIAGGFEPDRYTEAWSTDTRKMLVFGEWSENGDRIRTSLNAAVGSITRDVLPDSYVFITAEQRVRAGQFRVSNDFQLDRHPDDGSWSLARWNARLSAPLSERLTATARLGVRHYYAYWLSVPDFSSKRTQISAGLHYRMQNHSFGFNALGNQFSGRQRNRSVSISARTHPSWSPIAISHTSSVWDRASGTTIYSTTRVERDTRRLTYGLDYSLLLVDQVGPWEASHIGGLFFRWSMERWGYLSFRERVHIGSSVMSSTSYLTWGVSF